MRFDKIIGAMPRYGSGQITTAYRLESGAIIGQCPSTKEWLKWMPTGPDTWQLNNSLGRTRATAAALTEEVKIGNYTEAPAMDGYHPIVRWYDNRTQCWVRQELDAEGNQIGESFYSWKRPES